MSDIEHMQATGSDDPLYRLLVPLLPGLGRFRVAALQRSFMIGYNRASRLLERLEKDGHIKEVPDERGGYFVATPRDA